LKKLIEEIDSQVGYKKSTLLVRNLFVRNDKAKETGVLPFGSCEP